MVYKIYGGVIFWVAFDIHLKA